MSLTTKPTAPTSVDADDYADYDEAYRAAKKERVVEVMPYATTADIVPNLITDYPKSTLKIGRIALTKEDEAA